ncbi:hypothetical protein ACS78V_22225, partial [Yersinia enterocolitica]
SRLNSGLNLLVIMPPVWFDELTIAVLFKWPNSVFHFRLLPALVLDETPVRLGLTGVLGLDDDTLSDDIPEYYTVELGHYSGLTPQKYQEGNRRVSYDFEK